MALANAGFSSFDILAPDLFSPDIRNMSLSSSTPSFSRSTTPSSSYTSGAQASSTHLRKHSDAMISPSSATALGVNRFISPSSRKSSSGSCEEKSCSRCRMTEEEARQIKAERRKEQNRASQRRFRAKKESEIRGAADQVASLERVIQELQKQNCELTQTNVALMARLAELENQSFLNGCCEVRHGTDSAPCLQQCRKQPSSSTPDIVDYSWPIGFAEGEQHSQLGAYLPLFDHQLLHFDADP